MVRRQASECQLRDLQSLFPCVLFFLFLGLLAQGAAGQACPAAQNPPACLENPAGAADTVDQWKCWQKTLRSSGYAGANAYRDLEITVEYRNTATNVVTRRGWGFWDCTEPGGQEAFRIRTALPAGSYKWTVACRRRAGAPSSVKDCATDSNLNGKTGNMTVRAKTVGNDRYDRGFPQMAATRRYLKQGATTVPFFWLADTAWAAVKKANRAGDWATYLEARRKQGFSVVLLATAPDFAGVTEAEAFQQLAGCASDGTRVPNNCSRWNPPYWQQLEAKIQDSNAKGLVVLVAGVMDPLNRQAFGSPTWLSIFARNLAARLSGHHVIFSPGFDHLVTEQAKPLIQSVGAALDQAAPAHLVTHHAGGSSTCADYTEPLQTQSWHDFHLFQSGHCNNTTLVVSEHPCDPRRAFSSGPDEAINVCVTRRARAMSEDLFKISPVKPVANGEAVYDGNPANQSLTTPPNDRNFVRQTAYLSTLSGSFGFTYGVNYFWQWNVTSSTLSAQLGPVPGTSGTLPNPPPTAHSAWDMQRLASIFKLRPWKQFAPEPARILNQQTADEKKMVYAHSTNYTFNMAYLPNHPAGGGDPGNNKVRLNLSGLSPAFVCGGTAWTATWQNPRSKQTVPITTSLCQAAGSLSFDFFKPSCSNPPCDWVLTIDKTGAKVDESGDPVNSLQAWPELTEEGATIRAQAYDAEGQRIAEPVVLSQSSEEVFRKQPVVAREGGDHGFLVIWESEYQDGSLYGIFGRRFDSQGFPLGDEFQVNTYTEHDQAEPWAAASASGKSVVVWMSFDQDGDLGGIFGQRYDELGKPDGPEFQVNATKEGHQGSPLMGMDQWGDFVVAWESESQDGEGSRIFAQRFDPQGLPIGPEFQVNSTEAGEQILASLEVSADGEFEISWYDYDLKGNLVGSSSQSYSRTGELQD